jgi:hypothetical protein
MDSANALKHLGKPWLGQRIIISLGRFKEQRYADHQNQDPSRHRHRPIR